ncbi:sporulation membrane protein YtaF [Brevibacillus laterosporus]|uniref:sporulation membrane protein YtaF n=1 Tax=Brevibacillus laterosporus TaxID=1465 RepID=UPI000368EB5C|nr:sporulation membrane protein YtaF [Brevibacillus laterosporus]ATO48305.1 sporulation membrane protein YtaF [Brevibacillus laterosporus DSM 25]MED2005883.1 sporulation membrane protein YtaF [Brevibacillus laterosporus]NKQ19872.1 sporulation membrane protein YtaF [Brevibacillus laterosporus]PPA84077.1 sporulation membrane protein YtaF [Brevibacillus laterosporus]WNX30294.1 sporulation membrane protein YtaF [Brevibacillus laterosporus]
MNWLLILGFAVSSSLDNLGVGISYGIRNIRIGFLSNCVIAGICFILSEIGIYFGQLLTAILPGILPVLIGALLLFVIGVRIILLAFPRKEQVLAISSEGGVNTRSIKGILQNPEEVDLDKSGGIGVGEAFILGIALAANAVTNGLSAGLMGLSPHAISLTAAIGSFITLWAGVALGKKVASIRIASFTLGQFGTIISGVMLLVIAANTLL